MSRAVSERALQFEHHQAIAIDTQALLADGPSGHISTYFFKLGPFMRFTGDGAVERESVAGDGERLGTGAARLHGQQRVVQPHRGAPSLRTSGETKAYCRASQLFVGGVHRQIEVGLLLFGHQHPGAYQCVRDAGDECREQGLEFARACRRGLMKASLALPECVSAVKRQNMQITFKFEPKR